jgi:hypothetical protein
LTEDFHFDINSDEARDMIQEDFKENGEVEVSESSQPPEWSNIPNGYLSKMKQVLNTLPHIII